MSQNHGNKTEILTQTQTNEHNWILDRLEYEITVCVLATGNYNSRTPTF